jgi:hypothetical protein
MYPSLIPSTTTGDERTQMEDQELTEAQVLAGHVPGLQAMETKLLRWLIDEQHLVNNGVVTSFRLILGDNIPGTPGLFQQFLLAAAEKASPFEARAFRHKEQCLADRIARCRSANNWSTWPGQSFKGCFEKGTGDRNDKVGFVAQGCAFEEMERLGIQMTGISPPKLTKAQRLFAPPPLPNSFKLCLLAPPTSAEITEVITKYSLNHAKYPNHQHVPTDVPFNAKYGP